MHIFLQSSGSGGFINIIFILGFVVILYFFMIRPQQRKQKLQTQFIKSLKKGDEVITAGGMYGKIIAIDEGTVTLELEKGGYAKFNKNFISFENSKPLVEKKK